MAEVLHQVAQATCQEQGLYKAPNISQQELLATKECLHYKTKWDRLAILQA